MCIIRNYEKLHTLLITEIKKVKVFTSRKYLVLLKEGGPLPCPESGYLSNTRKWHVLTKQEILWDRVARQRAVGWGGPGERLCHMACSVFMVMGLVSGLSLTTHSDSKSFLVVHSLFSEKDSGRWLDTWCHFLIFPELCWLVIAY